MHPLLLSCSEAFSAGIPRVIHEVIDQVEAWEVRAAVLVCGAVGARGGLCLSRCVVDIVTLSFTATLKGVEETKPMADFVCPACQQDFLELCLEGVVK